MANSTVTLAEAAIAYARAGHAVLPLKPGTKVPNTINGKNDATTDVETIRRWWNRDPDSNIGLRPAQGVAIIETTDRAATLRSIMSQSFRLTGASPAQLRQVAVEDGPLARPTFYRALSDLVESGWLMNTGTDKRPFYVISSQEG